MSSPAKVALYKTRRIRHKLFPYLSLNQSRHEPCLVLPLNPFTSLIELDQSTRLFFRRQVEEMGEGTRHRRLPDPCPHAVDERQD